VRTPQLFFELSLDVTANIEPNNDNGWFVNLLYNGTRYGSDSFDKDYVGASDPNRYLPPHSRSVTGSSQSLG
jgi:hypothetical protein